MAPGRTCRPVASSVSRADGMASCAPTASTLPSLMATLAANCASGDTTVPPRITRSATATSRPLVIPLLIPPPARGRSTAFAPALRRGKCCRVGVDPHRAVQRLSPRGAGPPPAPPPPSGGGRPPPLPGGGYRGFCGPPINCPPHHVGGG